METQWSKNFSTALMAKGHDEVVEMMITLFTKFDLSLSPAQTDKFYEFVESNEAKIALEILQQQVLEDSTIQKI